MEPSPVMMSLFLSTPSARRATAAALALLSAADISIHALREEGDSLPPMTAVWPCYFYPRPPRGGRPATFSQCSAAARYFYPRPPRGGRP